MPVREDLSDLLERLTYADEYPDELAETLASALMTLFMPQNERDVVTAAVAKAGLPVPTASAADGTAGIAGIVSLTFFAVAAANGQYLVAGLSIALAGCSFGFLPRNFYPASIFMGDG